MGGPRAGVLLRDTPRPKTDAGAGSDVRAGEPEPDEWDTIVFRLNDEHGIDPCRFGDLTYPQIVCLRSRGQASHKRTANDRARKVLAQFRAGQLNW